MKAKATAFVRFFTFFCGLLGLFSTVSAGVLRLDFQPIDGGKRLSPGDEVRVGAGRLKLGRLDWLVSELSIQKEDGEWVHGREWFRYLSLAEGRFQADADGVSDHDFRAIRFRVGVSPAVDLQDPAQWETGHALHPNINHLHWGWQGGYVFLAVEGRRMTKSTDPDGLSYHLARAAEPMWVELPVKFRGGGPVTIAVEFDIAKVFADVDLKHAPTATHSRDGDEFALLLKRNVKRSFRVAAVSGDLYQATDRGVQPVAALPEGTNPFPLEVTSRFPKFALPADNPLTSEGVDLGRRLFHERLLSGNRTQSCASCHNRRSAFSDARRFSVGAEGAVGKRQAMPLFNLGWQSTFFWDGRAQSLREQVLQPIQDPAEMHQSLERATAALESEPTYRDNFARAFGSPGITADRIARAIEQYLLTLVSQDSRFDRAARKISTLSEEEKRGLQLFVTEFAPERGLRGADCFHCHGGTLFTSHQFHNNGLDLAPEDTGRMAVTRNPLDRGKFRAPSLRNIEVTAPYMHDGRFATLEEVVEHYSSGVRRTPALDPNLAKHPTEGLQLTTEEKRALVAFLKSLTDVTFLRPGKPGSNLASHSNTSPDDTSPPHLRPP